MPASRQAVNVWPVVSVSRDSPSPAASSLNSEQRVGSSPFHSLPTAGSLFVLIKYLMGRFKRSAGLASVSGGVGCIVSLHGCRFSLFTSHSLVVLLTLTVNNKPKESQFKERIQCEW